MAAETEKARGFFTVIMTAIANCSLYSREHPSVGYLAEKAFDEITGLVSGTEGFEVMIVENDLVINKTPLKDAGLHSCNFLRRLIRKGITRIDFLPGITLPEVRQFIADVAETGGRVRPLPHIRTGVVEVRTAGIKMDAGIDIDGLTRFASEQVERVKEIYSHVSPFRQMDTAGLEEIVVNFISTFRREASILHLVSPVKAHSEYTYTHATNVAVLSLFQAESLGIRDELLHDIGISALLHDVGKLFVSKDILDKEGALDNREWEEIRRHTWYGARYLAKIDGLTRLAPIVAVEHHMRFDGQGYPKRSTDGRQQRIFSQIVAVSDFYDALRSRRPYKRDWEIREILSLMKKNAGQDFNPFLVDNFVRIMSLALSTG